MTDCCPPAYLSCASLAIQLDCSESTVHELVRRGVLPKPLRLTGGTVRWRWLDVEAALLPFAEATTETSADPFLEGVANVKTKA